MAVDEAGDGNGATLKKKHLELLDLPAETQEEIVSHVRALPFCACLLPMPNLRTVC